MPIEYTIDTSLGLLTTTGVGDVTRGEMVQYKERLRSDPNLSCVTREISDFRGATFAAAPSHIADVARLHAGAFPQGQHTKCAVLVSSDLVYGLVRMYAVCVEPFGHEVFPFRQVSEAREWLGLESGDEDA